MKTWRSGLSSVGKLTPPRGAPGILLVLLALALLGPASAAHAQRPVRITLGVTRRRQTFETFSSIAVGPVFETDSTRYLHLGVSLDVLGRAPSSRSHVFGAVYFDHTEDIDDWGGSGDGGNYPSRTRAYSGGGFALRAHNTFGYVGAGAGLYRGGLGGKVFAGLQGRSALFAEAALTRTAHDPPADLTTSIGVRF